MPQKVVKSWLLLTSLICFSSLMIAYFYMEQYLELEPCALCILDRFIIGGIGVICLICLFTHPKGANFYFVLLILSLLSGFAVAIRHIWLIYVPQSTSCTFDDGSFSIINFITKAFRGTEDCGSVFWTFLGLSIPELTLILFVVLTIIIIYIIGLHKKCRKNIFK